MDNKKKPAGISHDRQEKRNTTEFINIFGERVHDILQKTMSEKANVKEQADFVDTEESTSETSSECIVEESDEEEIDLKTCSTRAYIENTVGQILLTALTILERERPRSPIKWIAKYIILHKDDPPEVKGLPLEEKPSDSSQLPKPVKRYLLKDMEDLEIVAVNKT